MSYDSNNIFAKIIRKEIPTEILYEDDFALAFNDINPKAPIHVLVISKAMSTNLEDFIAHSSDEEIAGYFRAINKIIKLLKLSKKGFRVVFNSGKHGGQEVPHLHAHILGGKVLPTDSL